MASHEPRSNGSSAPHAVPRRAFEVRGAGGARWREALADANLRAESPSHVSETLLDTFDRRLQRAGLSLAVHARIPRVQCRLARTHDGGRQRSDEGGGDDAFELAQVPVHAWDFPAGIAQRMAEVIEARGVHPIGHHELSCARWAVLDDEKETVAWIDEEDHEVEPRAGSARRASSVRRVVLQGVRGHGQEFARLRQRLEHVSGLAAVPETSFDASARLDAPPAPETRWPSLAPDVSAFDGLARIVRAQLAVIDANTAGTLADEDPEFLHDTRVALRRLRSLVSQLKGVLPIDQQVRLGAELRWLAASTGPARDLDTLLFELRLTPPELRAALEPAVTAFAAERSRLQLRLRLVLEGARARASLQRLRDAFGSKPDSRRAGPKAARPFALVVTKRLRRKWGQVVLRAQRLDAASPAPELHELRIACKKLRYLLECCRGLAPKLELARLFEPLKELQGVLGTIQDAEVHAHLVRELARTIVTEDREHALLALGRYLERLEQSSLGARRRFVELSAGFVSARTRAGFERLFRRLEHEPETAR